MESRKQIILSKASKGILVYARHKAADDNWLILISHVNEVENDLSIYRHISFNCLTKETFFDYLKHKPQSWGRVRNYDFYVPTEKEKKFITNKLADMGYKFIPILNKLVKKG